MFQSKKDTEDKLKYTQMKCKTVYHCTELLLMGLINTTIKRNAKFYISTSNEFQGKLDICTQCGSPRILSALKEPLSCLSSYSRNAVTYTPRDMR